MHTVRSTTKKIISSEKKSTEKLKYTLKIFNKNGGAKKEEKRNKKEMYKKMTKWKSTPINYPIKRQCSQGDNSYNRDSHSVLRAYYVWSHSRHFRYFSFLILIIALCGGIVLISILDRRKPKKIRIEELDHR